MAEKVALMIQYSSLTIFGLVIALIYSWKLALVTLSLAPLIVLSAGLMMLVSTIMFQDDIQLRLF